MPTLPAHAAGSVGGGDVVMTYIPHTYSRRKQNTVRWNEGRDGSIRQQGSTVAWYRVSGDEQCDSAEWPGSEGLFRYTVCAVLPVPDNGHRCSSVLSPPATAFPPFNVKVCSTALSDH